MKKINRYASYAGAGFLLAATLIGGYAYAYQYGFQTTGPLVPSANGYHNQWSGSSSASKYTLVDDSTCDGNATYVKTTKLGHQHSFALDLSSVPAGHTVVGVKLTPCVSRDKTGSGSSELKMFLRTNGVDSHDYRSYYPTGTTPVEGIETSIPINRFVNPSIEVGLIYASGNKGLRVSGIKAIIEHDIKPDAPYNFSATVGTPNASGTPIVLEWAEDSTNIYGFEIFRSTNGTSYPLLLQSYDENLRSYTDYATTTGTYYYKVRTGNGVGYTNFAGPISVTI